MRKFESKCQTCEGRVTTADSGKTWRHAKLNGRPETSPQRSWTRHYARPHGTMIQI